MKFSFFFCLFYLTSHAISSQELVKGNMFIAPLPAFLEMKEGSFTIDSSTWMLYEPFDTSSFDPLKVFNEVFQQKSGYALKVSGRGDESGDVKNMILIIKAPPPLPQFDNEESYKLSIQPSGIIIMARTNKAIFYAFQTLRQIMRMDVRPDAGKVIRKWEIPCLQMTDFPQFPYRGMHLDVCRHFMPIDFVKKYIDLLAFYKMNTFHWHLTDDQGWRIEIKKYPKLQEVAAWRDETLIGHYKETPDRYDGTRHGGYYTQEQIKDVVAYAADRGVTIIPEIEMPGHALAALSAYPELACTSGPFKSATTWGVFDDVFCPTETTFTFLENVLDEVIELFPSTYIHIGGDECPKKRWKESAFCQQLMQAHGLRDEHQLQSYFTQRIEKYLNNKGRRIIGWDEIVEGGLAPNATVMSWRGMSGGIEAAKAGHDVIMTPGTHCYFDHYQAEPALEPVAYGGLTTLEKVYSFNPVPAQLTSSEAKHILGAQGNLWTEYIGSPYQAAYMAFPRAIALAEVLWTPSEKRNWNEFALRLDKHLDRLDGMDVHYANHLQVPTAEVHSNADGLQLKWKTPIPGQEIYYARDTSSQVWSHSMSGDSVLFTGPGPVFYKTSHSGIKKVDFKPSKASKSMITSSVPPSKSYPGKQGIATLADGLTGKSDFNGEEWCGWNEAEFTIDLEFPSEINIDSITIGLLSSQSSWIYNPEKIVVRVSKDPDFTDYRWVGWSPEKNLQSGLNKIILTVPPTQGRYIRLIITPLISIPEGKPGAGQPAWTFIDEIGVN
jgi:hexosaminidase